ncbi:hypothetical protein Gohar_013209, partial [Gossypium harknessii]|nr:hypothetical protein [Gossypium harknessii]
RPHGLRDERSSLIISGIRAIGSNAPLGCQKKSRTKVGEKVFEGDDVGSRGTCGDYVNMSLDSTMDKVNELFNSHRDKLTERNYALEAMVMALKEETMVMTMALSTRIEELEAELALCRASVGKGVSSATLSY